MCIKNGDKVFAYKEGNLIEGVVKLSKGGIAVTDEERVIHTNLSNYQLLSYRECNDSQKDRIKQFFDAIMDGADSVFEYGISKSDEKVFYFDDFAIESYRDFFLFHAPELVKRLEKIAVANGVNDCDITIFLQKNEDYDFALFAGYSFIPFSDLSDELAERIPLTFFAAEYTLMNLREELRVFQKIEDIENEGKLFANLPVKEQIKKWLNSTSFSNFSEALKKRVIGQKNVRIIAGYIYNYLECIAYERPVNCNLLLAAPSGSGKTETYRAIRDYFKEEIPRLIVYQVDMTQITSEGFKGKDTNHLVLPLLDDIESNGVGIVFIDEFDKRLMPIYDGHGKNVNDDIQGQILTLIEGRKVYKKDSSSSGIDTSNTMFIGAGAFNACREQKAEVIKHVGFGARPEGGLAHYSDITKEDIIKLGASYELVGRFAELINYHELSYPDVERIIRLSADRIGASLGFKISIRKSLKDYLHAKANGEYGCRLIDSIIRKRAMKLYIDAKEKEKVIEKMSLDL